MTAPTREHGRFAPTTSGPAHPGTLLAGLLAWLDARSLGARFSLRLEDIDPDRCRPEHAQDMLAALAWLGLDWDACSLQSEHQAAFEAALDRLAERGLLYPCACSRADVQRAGVRAVDGSWRYPGTCRARALPPGGWRESADAAAPAPRAGARRAAATRAGSTSRTTPASSWAIRCCAGATARSPTTSPSSSTTPRRRVTRVVRGRDLAACTALHVVLQRALGLATPRYRHHLLLREARGEKLAKLHGAVGWRELRERYTAEAFCGWLAHACGPARRPRPREPRASCCAGSPGRACAARTSACAGRARRSSRVA